MTQEEKQLLMQDLCARLPYEPKARKDGMETSINLTTLDSFYYGHEIILPYLRRMSSMTEDERVEYLMCCDADSQDVLNHPHYRGTDWLNAHHFDYRNLIEKGLAFEAPEGMYDI